VGVITLMQVIDLYTFLKLELYIKLHTAAATQNCNYPNYRRR
jgi:hypothetical protein